MVEVVSASTKADDYRSKRSEYSLLEIPEYWIVDPLDTNITLCTLQHRFYDAIEFHGNTPINSPTFPTLALTAQEILRV